MSLLLHTADFLVVFLPEISPQRSPLEISLQRFPPRDRAGRITAQCKSSVALARIQIYVCVCVYVRIMHVTPIVLVCICVWVAFFKLTFPLEQRAIHEIRTCLECGSNTLNLVIIIILNSECRVAHWLYPQ